MSQIVKIAVTIVALLLTACSKEEAEAPYEGAMVLAISWQPGFCETRPRLPECRSQNEDRFDARNFTLHGLWPQPGSNIYCGVDPADIAQDKSRRWKRLAALGLSEGMRERLWEVMPGVRSFLHRHEWVKHGTCYSASPEIYYRDSLRLMDKINGSDVQRLFSSSIGRALTSRDVRQAFDKAFGAGTGQRVKMACKRDQGRMVITELTLGLSGRVTEDPDIGVLARASRQIRAGCPVGIVDAVGLQ